MNSVILCEGETDQILLSYYLNKCFGFEYCKKQPAVAPKKLHSNNSAESVCCYSHDDDIVVIWAVGGHSELQLALEKILHQNKINSPRNGFYSRICVMTDNDSEQELKSFWVEINNSLKSYNIHAEFQEMEWTTTEQSVDFDGKLPIELLGIPVPTDQEGALETALLNALGERQENAYIVEKSCSTVDDLIANKDKFSEDYLSSRREQVKAPLAVFLAITVPERIFQPMDKMLKSIEWNKYEKIKELFEPFEIFKAKGANAYEKID
ncbi:MAG: DUF3226 domain-containing protein [Selenomonadaceae bacterium]|nr:DUF3226 domain-containing protein [Selenomonadaceae bacterium]